jgi:hypothetical protein
MYHQLYSLIPRTELDKNWQLCSSPADQIADPSQLHKSLDWKTVPHLGKASTILR